ncbi:hypothetical protein PTKIN_Ptkin02bG0038600 [Pterospermum kingtungense]
MVALSSLDLATNKFTGPLPDNLPLCKQLKTVNLARNSFSGQIPESFKEFHSLSYLSLSNSSLHNLSSALQILQHCRNLTTLVLTLNFPDETLPDDPNLHFEKLKFNNLSRPIPENLSGMTRLEVRDLSHNYLSGTIPSSLQSLSFLSRFDVAYNKLYGMIPSGGQFQTFPNSSFEGNNLCGNLSVPLWRYC